MNTSIVQYSGDLRCSATHSKSGISIISDAPLDNHGRGEAFSPTCLLATSLAMCMMTIMGIAAKEKNIPLEGLQASVTKIMGQNPRRVQEVHIQMSGNFSLWDKKQWAAMKAAAENCPVMQSIHPDLKVNLEWMQA